MTLVIENVYDDLVDPELNGEFVSYHLEGMCLVAVDHTNNDARYLVDVKLHPLDREDYDEGPIIIDAGGGFGKMIINGRPKDRKTVRDNQEEVIASMQTSNGKTAMRKFFDKVNTHQRGE